MRPRRTPAASAAAVLVTVAVALLGVRLFLPGAAVACATEGRACCCPEQAPEPGAPADGTGCDCSISPAAPVPAAVLVPVDGAAPPVVVAGEASGPASAAPEVATPEALPVARARSAPTQSLLETFRN